MAIINKITILILSIAITLAAYSFYVQNNVAKDIVCVVIVDDFSSSILQLDKIMATMWLKQ